MPAAVTGQYVAVVIVADSATVVGAVGAIFVAVVEGDVKESAVRKTDAVMAHEQPGRVGKAHPNASVKCTLNIPWHGAENQQEKQEIPSLTAVLFGT